MSSDTSFTRENLDYYLKELAKEFRKLNGKTVPAEIILVGGASILTNYGFREMTYDMDAIINASSAMKTAINHVGDKFGLPNGWLNTDFSHTKSYTPKLVEHSVYYKTFYGIITVRTVFAEYLVAMKLMSGRQYKNDLSDIVGIIAEHRERRTSLTYEQIDRAVVELYESWNDILPELKDFLLSALESPDTDALYEKYRNFESESKDVLLDFEQKYPGAAKEDNIAAILERARQKKEDQNTLRSE